MSDPLERRRDGCSTEGERDAYAEALEDAAQRARYLLKHQNLEGEDEDQPYNQGFAAACNILDDVLEQMATTARSQPLKVSRETSPKSHSSPSVPSTRAGRG